MVCSLFKLGISCSSMPVDKLLIEYLLVPSVVFILFLYISVGILVRDGHKKIKSLLVIVFYILIVYTGMYGMMAVIITNYIILFIFATFFLFIFSRFVPPSGMLQISKIASLLGEKKYDATILKDRIEVKKEEIKRLRARLEIAKNENDHKEMSILNALITEAEMERDLYEKQLKRSEKLIPS